MRGWRSLAFGRGDGMEEFVDGSNVFQDDGAVAGKEVVGGKDINQAVREAVPL